MRKGIVSLEYVLVFAGVLSILAITTTAIVDLYFRNINAIDNHRLKENCKEIKLTIELFELMPEGLREIELNNLNAWQMLVVSEKELTLKNNQKECKIFSRQNLKTITTIEKNKKLNIQKQNNILNIS